MKVREIMDSNRNGFIERDELSQFLIGCGINFSHQELGRLIDFFDVNKDRLISIQEFADALNYQNKNKNMIKTNNSFDGVSNYIVGYLISYMKKMKRTMPQLFNEIDLNGDGYLSR
jgi:Ca2+-binding EF-hand superfamily protein